MDFIVIVKILINFLLNQSILFFAEFLKDKPNKLKQNKKNKTGKKTYVYDTSSELYNILLETSHDEYYDLSDAKRSRIDPKYNHPNFTLDKYDYKKI